jgi:hypothetical protein
MTRDEENARSPHDLTTAEGCRAEAERAQTLCQRDGIPAVGILAWLDWMTEARIISGELTIDTVPSDTVQSSAWTQPT